MLEKMVGSTSSSRNIYGFVNDNNNSYRSMVMDAMRMNRDYPGEGSCNIPLDEEPNINAAKFFDFLKDLDE
jgi:hypothetical protein